MSLLEECMELKIFTSGKSNMPQIFRSIGYSLLRLKKKNYEQKLTLRSRKQQISFCWLWAGL